MFTENEILETIDMLDNRHLDVRTVTASLSLLDCIDGDGKKCAAKVYDKIMRVCARLVPVCDSLAARYGVKIVNKRIAVTPVSVIGSASGDFIGLAHALDRAGKNLGVDFVGGYSALVQKGATARENEFLDTIPQALSETDIVCSSVNVASSKTGINMDAVGKLGKIIKDLAYRTREINSFGCGKLVVFCNAVDDNPFMAGAFTGLSEGECAINVGVSGPGVVEYEIKKHPDYDITQICELIKRTAFKITRLGALIGTEAARELGLAAGIVDLSLAPTPAIGDSVARILESIGLSTVGSCGTTACLALLNDAVKKGGVMAASRVGGLSGAFIPVSEDAGMIEAARSGALNLEKLEAMTAVCSVGLDMIAVAGDTTAAQLSAMIADECAIGMINNKTTAVRVIPVYGKTVGDEVNFGGLFGTAPVMAVNGGAPDVFVNRGGVIPPPIHANKN
ncbi:PFL family protein [Anaerocaecibacter muris]|uniref:PFL family protein n=1 Tax=Anaerocaecibacter muris TaxID=2941513 RepID=UPI00203E9153|nr:PFL family protein [Anaerocaecibacter muris]